MERKIELNTPWATFYNEIKAMFGQDTAIRIEYDVDKNEIKMRVTGQEKAEALTKILPPEKKFGNVTVKVTVIPANKLGAPRADVFQKAFEGNPVLSYVKTVPVFGAEFDYVVFKNEVVQFYNDDISDINGNESTLYENIAMDIFGDIGGVLFCTDLPGVE